MRPVIYLRGWAPLPRHSSPAIAGLLHFVAA